VKEAKLMDWHKDSLTEQQREKKITTIILIKRIYRVQFSHHSMPSLLLSRKLPSPSQLHHLDTKYNVSQYQKSHLFG